MNLDLILPYKHTGDDFELKHSLRSLAKFGKGFSTIWIVGDIPTFLRQDSNLLHLPMEDKYTPARNIMRKIMEVCKQDDAPVNLMLWNDDYFLAKSTDFTDYPNYNCGDLGDLLEMRKEQFDGYRIQVNNTYQALAMRSKPTYNFDCHCPIIFNKFRFIEVMNQYSWQENKQGFCVKSLYANHLNLPSVYRDDCNITEIKGTIESTIGRREIFSVHPAGLSDRMREYLRETYTEKSIYEI